MPMRRLLSAALAATLLAGCGGGKSAAPAVDANGHPLFLSGWDVISVANGVLSVDARATPYDLATPLFSDYASKLRTVTMPPETAATYSAEEVFDLPVGTVITKTFYYAQKGETWTGAVSDLPAPTAMNGSLPLKGIRLIETRVLARRAEGWIALPYVWNEAQTDAELKRTGAIASLTLHRGDNRKEDFAYLVPNQNQCAGCHASNNTTRAIAPIGIRARHLNKPSTFHDDVNQLDYWRLSGKLVVPAEFAASAPRNAQWGDPSFTVEERARAYLDVNCSHCHSDVGPADTSGLDLRPHVAFGPSYGRCKSPIAAGSGSGGRLYDIVPGAPEESIFVFRMQTKEPGKMMPELGRALTHEEGVDLVADWIRAMEGGCA